MKAIITIMLKDGVLDPQGKAIEGALTSIGFSGVAGARQGKIIELDLEDQPEDQARAKVTEMCDKLLANTVIERYDIALEN